MAYYTARELPFYYSLFGDSGLCANYFSSVLGGTLPNRYYLMSGTSGGITTNGKWGYGVFDSAAGRSSSTCSSGRRQWKIYYIGFETSRRETATTSPSSGAGGPTTRAPRG